MNQWHITLFPIKRTVFLCTVTVHKNMVRLIGNIEYVVSLPAYDLQLFSFTHLLGPTCLRNLCKN